MSREWATRLHDSLDLYYGAVEVRQSNSQKGWSKMKLTVKSLLVVLGSVVFLSGGRPVMTTGQMVASPVTAGPLTWKYSSYCNRITLLFHDEGSGGLSRVVGTDDRCGGATQLGAVSGSLHINPDGTAGLGTTTYFPSGTYVYEICTINVNTGNGTCLDSRGTTTTLTLGGLTSGDDRQRSRESR